MSAAPKLTRAQNAALDQLYAGRGFACNAGITNSTNSALQRRGLTDIKVGRDKFGFTFTWVLTPQGIEAGRERVKAKSAMHARITRTLSAAQRTP